MRNQTAVGEKQADVVLTNLFDERPKPAERAPLQPSWPQTRPVLHWTPSADSALSARHSYYFYCDLVNLFWFLLYGDTLCYLSFLHHVLLDLIKNFYLIFLLFKLHIITLTFPFFIFMQNIYILTYFMIYVTILFIIYFFFFTFIDLKKL